MTRTIVYCDRCKKPVVRDAGTELVVEAWGGRPEHKRESLDLCGPCSNELTAWLSVPALSHPPLRALARSAG